MFIDALVTAAVADELRSSLAGARVQEVLQPDRPSIVLELYSGTRTYVTLSADPNHEGITLGPERSRRGDAPATPLTLAARAHLVGARLADVTQPPYERVLDLSFHGEATWRLLVEIMGRLANVIMLDDHGVVVAAAHSVTAEMSRARTVLPGRPYVAPPPPAKVTPDAVTVATVEGWLAEAPTEPAWRSVVRNCLGASPLVAREAVYRAAGNAHAAAGDVPAGAVADAVADLFAAARSGSWAPCVAMDAEGAVVAYAPYPLTHLDAPNGAPPTTIAAVPTIAAAISAYALARGTRDPYREARAAVTTALGTVHERVARRRAALAAEVVDAGAIERLRLAGDLILAFQTSIARGQAVFEPPPDTGLTGPVTLDPALSPVDNAAAYYDHYRRRKRAAAAAPARLAEAEAALATLDQLAVDLELAEDRPGIDAVRACLVDAGLIPAQKHRPAAPKVARPLQLVSSDGMTLLVGRNSRQNEQVTFARAVRGDLWLHARGTPGGHVVVKTGGRPVPDRTVHEAAAVAAHFSRARGEAKADVVVVDVRHVRRLRGGGPGMVSYDHERTLTVGPASPESLGLT